MRHLVHAEAQGSSATPTLPDELQVPSRQVAQIGSGLWYCGTLDPKNAPWGQLETCHEASWRYGPCRIQDPMMVETYRCGLCALRYCKYNRLGLLIYSLNPQIPVNRWSPSGHLTLSHCCNDHGICFLPVQKASDDVRTHTKATVDIEGWNIRAVVI